MSTDASAYRIKDNKLHCSCGDCVLDLRGIKPGSELECPACGAAHTLPAKKVKAKKPKEKEPESKTGESAPSDDGEREDGEREDEESGQEKEPPPMPGFVEIEPDEDLEALIRDLDDDSGDDEPDGSDVDTRASPDRDARPRRSRRRDRVEEDDEGDELAQGRKQARKILMMFAYVAIIGTLILGFYFMGTRGGGQIAFVGLGKHLWFWVAVVFGSGLVGLFGWMASVYIKLKRAQNAPDPDDDPRTSLRNRTSKRSTRRQRD
jgi:hypothetical protein